MTIEEKMDLMCKLILNPDDHAARKMLQGDITCCTNPGSIAAEILLDLGAPDNLAGYPYVHRAITLAAEKREYLQRITLMLYPRLAAEFDVTSRKIERSITRVIEAACTRCDYFTLQKYFGNTISQDKGKPTNREFIARISNVVRERMRGGDDEDQSTR